MRVCACMRVCMRACMHVCACTCVRARVHVCVSACMHACIRACMCVHAYVHEYVYACTNIHIGQIGIDLVKPWLPVRPVTRVRFQTQMAQMEHKIANLYMMLAQKDEEIQQRKFKVTSLLIHICNSLHVVDFPWMVGAHSC